MSACGGKARDHPDVVGHSRREQVRQEREFILGRFVQPAAQQRVAGLQHPVERAAPPALGGLDILGIGAGCRERVWAGAAIFEQRRFGGTKSPAEQATLVDRMKRVDEHLGATDRNPSRNATLAESGHDVGFGGAGKARLGQPCRQCVEGGFVHCAII